MLVIAEDEAIRESQIGASHGREQPWKGVYGMEKLPVLVETGPFQ